MSEFIFPIHIYTEDTDYSGVVYHANFLKYMERARTAWCSHIHLPLAEMAKENIFFVVRSAQIEYLAPARLNDELEVVSQIEKFGHTSLLFAQDIRLAQSAKIICQGKITLVCINEKLRPRELPAALRNLA